MQLTDSHFHAIIMADKGLDAAEHLIKLSGGIDAGCEISDIERRSEFLSPFSHIKLAGGMGPWCTQTEDEDSLFRNLETLGKLIKQYRLRFIGEIGLDYYRNYGTPELQQTLFEKQLVLAGKLNLRVLIHSREASADTCRAISAFSGSSAGVIHCFDGSLNLLRTALDNGFWISYAGNLTYKSNSQLRETLKLVPTDRLLLETDSPYLTPVPLRGCPNVPSNIIHTYRCAAEVLNITPEELSQKIYENFLSFCG